MRAIAGGSIVLAFAVVLLSWDASRRFTHVRQASQLPSIEIGGTRASDIEHAEPVAPAAAPAAESPKPMARLPAPTPQAGATAEKPAAESVQQPSQSAALPGVRRFTPGSKAHVEALLTAIDSEQSRDTVAPIARLYFAFFDRASDYEGLNYYIGERDGGMSLEAIAEDFAGSAEFRIRYGTLDNAAFFDRIYRNAFEVAPDATQRAYWLAMLDGGMSRGQVMLAFSESNAFRTATSNEVFVTMAYAQALRTEPDPAGFARWVRFLDAGNPREAMIAGLLGSTRTKR